MDLVQYIQKIQAIAQSGLAYSNNEFDKERYDELLQISTEMMADVSHIQLDKIYDIYTKEKGYATPKVDIRGVVFQNNKILLVKEKSVNKWSVPGGFCDVGLSPGENVVKEIKEESGFDVIPKRIIAVFDSNKHEHGRQLFQYYKIIILCKIIGGQACAGIETNDVKFFAADEIPPLSTARITKKQIQLFFEYAANEEKSSLFD